jgi:NRE family putative nickel resistance protein-like MFS transporter
MYLTQAISLFGDAFTWLGLALLSYQFGPERSAVILSTALTLRVTAFILFAPIAGVWADRANRKTIMVLTHFARMGVVSCFPFVTQEWQLYALVFLLNVFYGFFSPAYRAAIPHTVPEQDYRPAVGLSAATFQLLGVLGPGVAGIFASWLGPREIFLADAASFVIAGVLVLLLPSDLGSAQKEGSGSAWSAWREVWEGMSLLFGHPYLRLALAAELLAAFAGAQILVNTVGFVKGGMGLDDQHYGWVMSALALGAALAAFLSGRLDKSPSRRLSLVLGSAVLGLAVAAAGQASFTWLLLLWLFAGAGQSLAEIPSETLIAENIDPRHQGKVYGAHFAVSHLWWAFSYPVAGRLGQIHPGQAFTWSGGAVVAASLLLGLWARATRRTPARGTVLVALLLLALANSPQAARAEEWVELKTFPRFVLYVDADSLLKQSEDEVEITQKTILTEKGQAYFRDSYAKLKINDEPPHAVVTRECYLRSRAHRTLIRVYQDDEGNVLLKSTEPTALEAIPAKSLYETVWLYIFDGPRLRAMNAFGNTRRGDPR